MPIVIDPNIRQVYREAKDTLLPNGYGIKAAHY
jgi:hypothetical protein